MSSRLFILLLLAVTVPAAAAQVVLVTIDNVSPGVGFTTVAAALAPDGRAARALLVGGTARRRADLYDRGDAYLTMNAGSPAATANLLDTLMEDGRRLNLAAYLEAGYQRIPPDLGNLGAALQDHGLRTAAVGSANALGLIMNRRGTANVVDPRPLQATAADLARTRRLLSRADVAVVDISGMWSLNEQESLAWLKSLLDGLASSTRVLVCCPMPIIDEATSWAATWVIMPRTPASGMALYSPSTRRAGLVANTDIAATLASWAGVAGRVGNGRAITPSGKITTRQLTTLETALRERTRLRAALLLRFAYVLTFSLLALAVLVSRWGRRSAFVGAVSQDGCAVSEPRNPCLVAKNPGFAIEGIAVLIPAGWLAFTVTGIFPSAPATLALELAGGLLLALAAALLFRGQRVPVLWLSAAIALLCCYLVVPNWNYYNLVSYNVLRDSRYYGLGNPAAGMVVAGVLAFAMLTLAGSRRWRLAALLLPWGVAAWIFLTSGAANFGMGLAATVVAFVTAIVRIPARRRLAWVLGLGALMILLLGGLIAYDVLSGRESHIARLATDIGREGLAPLGQVILRKGRTAWRLLSITVWSYILEAALIVLGVFLLKTRAWWRENARVRELLWIGLAAVGASLLLNDSGVEPASLLATCLVTGLVSLRLADARAEEAAARPTTDTAGIDRPS